MNTVEPTMTFPMPSPASKPPLLLRFARRCTIGRWPETGEDIVVDVGAVLDATQLECAGILTGGCVGTGEEFAQSAINGKRAELVNAGDVERLKRLNPWLKRGSPWFKG